MAGQSEQALQQLNIPIKAMPALSSLYDQNYYALAMTYLDRAGITDKLTKTDKETFLMLCARNKLDPTLNEIYPIMKGNKLTIVTNYLIYFRRANQTGLFDGFDETEWGGSVVYKEVEKEYPVYEYGKIVGKEKRTVRVIDTIKTDLWCSVTLRKKDLSQPVHQKIWLSEFCSEEPGVWVTKPRYMIEKCCQAIVLRKTFQGCAEIESLPYTQEEMNSDPETIHTTVEITDMPSSNIPEQPENDIITAPEIIDPVTAPAPDVDKKITTLQKNCTDIIAILAKEQYDSFDINTRKENSINKHLQVDIADGWENMIKACPDEILLTSAFEHWKGYYKDALINSITNLIKGLDPDANLNIINKITADVDAIGNDTKKLRMLRDKLIKQISSTPFNNEVNK